MHSSKAQRSVNVLIAVAVVAGLFTNYAYAESHDEALQLEAKIPLGVVKGRIDHLAYDAKHQRLFVAELGNNSVGVIDLKDRKVIVTLNGFAEPQGIGYLDSTDTLYVANAGDGSVRLLHGADFTEFDRFGLGSDADNVRIDNAKQQIVVGYGNGALAFIDPSTPKHVANISLKAHPESFQLLSSGQNIVVNVPDAHEISVVDRQSNKQVQSWPTKELSANFPMAIDVTNQRVLVVFRQPSMLGVFDVKEGARVAMTETCGDSDDVFTDKKRRRVYVICGEGLVDVFSEHEGIYSRTARLKTVKGARTGFFVPELDRLFVAVRATASDPASVWSFRPTP